MCILLLSNNEQFQYLSGKSIYYSSYWPYVSQLTEQALFQHIILMSYCKFSDKKAESEKQIDCNRCHEVMR